MNVIGYIRTTDKLRKHSHSNHGLREQEAEIGHYCRAHGLVLMKIFVDTDPGAHGLTRPGLRRVFEEFDHAGHVVDGLVITKLEHIARSAPDWAYITEHYIGDSTKFFLVSIAEAIDTRTALGLQRFQDAMAIKQQEHTAARAMEQEAATQQECKTIEDRTEDALRRHAGQSMPLSRPPRGFTTIDGQTLPDPHSPEAKVAVIAFDLHDNGVSLRKIGMHLIDAGYRPKRGGQWHAATVNNILNNRWWVYFLRDPQHFQPEKRAKRRNRRRRRPRLESGSRNP